jgi:alpha-glucosidase
MYVVYESPFQMVSVWPERYKNDPSFEWIKKVPASWDQSIVLNGYPGEYVTIARKRGDDWYLGAMTNWTARDYEISLGFLDAGNYIAEVYADAPDADKLPKKVNIKTIKVTKNNQLKISMASAGGIAVHFRKTK